MDVREALTLPSMESADVIAGEAGLDNELTGAMVLEAADVENWGKRGQLIISSFYALEHLSQASIANLFRKMSAIGISAIAFKPERLMAAAPQQIIDLCNDFDLPLINLSPQVKYEAILMDVLGHILDSNLTLLNRFFDVHQHLMALTLKQPSISYILATLKNSLHSEITYLDTMRDRRIGTDAHLTEFSGYSLKRRDPSPYQTHAYYDARLLYENGTEGLALAVRIPSSDGVDYYVLIHSSNHQLTPLDTMTVENIVSLLQMEILKQNAIKQKLYFQNNGTVHDLLLDRFGSHERIDGALAELGIDKYPLYQVLLIRTNVVDVADTDRHDELQQAVRRRIRSMYPGTAYYLNGDRIVFLRNFRSDLSGIDLDAVQAMLNELHASSTLPPFTHLGVLSSAADRYGISRINADVVKVYRLFDKDTARDRCFRFEDLGVYKLLLNARDLSQLEDYIDPRAAKLVRENPDLFRTIARLCRNGLNYQTTADELYVHPKTVRYRVDRARELTGIDVRNPDDFLQVILAEKILALGEDDSIA